MMVLYIHPDPQKANKRGKNKLRIISNRLTDIKKLKGKITIILIKGCFIIKFLILFIANLFLLSYSKFMLIENK